MGQFKPMVKMMTTEPTIELKLKKGGAVEHPKKMMNGGVMSGLASAPTPGARGGMAPAARPKKPSMAARRAAMMGMKEGGDTALQKHASMPASKAHKGLKTGGVVMGQGGFKKGGAVPASGILPVAESERGAKGYKNTKMHTAQGEDHTPKKTGDVKLGNAGGFKKGGKACYAKGGGVEGNVSTSKPGVTNTTTGEVKKGNAGGYKKGGKAKKMAGGGLTEEQKINVSKGRAPDDGGTRYEANPRTVTPPPPVTPPEPPVRKFVDPRPRVLPPPSRTLPNRRGPMEYAKGGNAAKKAFAAGGSVNDSGRPVAYPAKPVSKSVKNNLQSGTFKKGGKVKMAEGGKIPAEAQSAIKQSDAERAFRDYEKAEAAENKAMRDSILGAPKRMFDAAKSLFKGKEAPSGSVTKTEKSVTVAPSKKRGGSVKC